MIKYDIEVGDSDVFANDLVDKSYIINVLDNAYDAFFVNASTGEDMHGKIKRMHDILTPIFADVLEFSEEKSKRVIDAYLEGKGISLRESGLVEDVWVEPHPSKIKKEKAVKKSEKIKSTIVKKETTLSKKKKISAYKYCLDKLVASGELVKINKRLALGLKNLTIENVTQAIADKFNMETRADAERLLIQYQACDFKSQAKETSLFRRIYNWFNGVQEATKLDLLEYALYTRKSIVEEHKFLTGKEYSLIEEVKDSTAILGYKINYKKLKKRQEKDIDGIYGDALKDIYRLPVKQELNKFLVLGLKKSNLSNNEFLQALVKKYNLASVKDAEYLMAQYSTLRFIGEKSYRYYYGKNIYSYHNDLYEKMALSLGKITLEDIRDGKVSFVDLHKADVLKYALLNKKDIFTAYQEITKTSEKPPIQQKYEELYDFIRGDITYRTPTEKNVDVTVTENITRPSVEPEKKVSGLVIGNIAITDKAIESLANCCQLFNFVSTEPEKMVENIRSNFKLKTGREAVLFAGEIAQLKFTKEQSEQLKSMFNKDKSIIFAKPIKVVVNYALNNNISPVQAYNKIFNENLVIDTSDLIVDIDKSNEKIENVSREEIDKAVRDSLAHNMSVVSQTERVFLSKENKDIQTKLDTMAQIFDTDVENVKFNIYQYQSISFQTKGQAYNAICKALGKERVTKIDLFNYAMGNKISVYEAYEKLSGKFIPLVNGYKKLVEEKQVTDKGSTL